MIENKKILERIFSDVDETKYLYTIDYFVSETVDAIVYKKFIEKCLKNKISIIRENISIETNIENLFNDSNLHLIFTKTRYFFGFHNDYENVYITGYVDSKLNNIINLDISGDIKSVHSLIEYFYSKYNKKNSVSISWYYNPKNCDRISLQINLSKLPCKEMYPYFNFNSLEEYYDKFNTSDENILILIGEPGTGKTTFIRGLLSHTKESASIIYDKNPLSNDDIFVDWFESNNKYFIFEDSDQLLIPREDQNDIMVKFLNIADGLISTSSKKIIFSTNLKSVNQIDEALIRPGRCFDILEFKKLNPHEVKILTEKMNLPYIEGERTLAEIFSNVNKSNKMFFNFDDISKHKIGFI